MNKWYWAAILGAIALGLYLFKDQLAQALKGSTAGTGATTGTGTTSTGASAPTYPVTIYSAPADIKAAFVASGYMASLQASVASGQYSTAYLDQVMAAPAAWLGAHTYLYSSYPQYFKAG